MKKTRIPAYVAGLALLGPAAGSIYAATAYHGFTRLDPVAKTMILNSYVVVEGERIVEVGRGVPPQHQGWSYVDMSGRYALPGMLDVHAHVTIGPLEVEVKDGAPQIRMRSNDSVTRYSAVAALASGVTTIRNPAGDPDVNARYAKKIRSGEWLGPKALQAGFAFDAIAIQWLTFVAHNEQEWGREIEREKSLGMQFVKLYSSLSEKDIALGVKLAHAHGMKTIAHLDRVSWTRAIELGVDALTHALPTSEALLPESARADYVASRAGPDAKFMYHWFELADFDGPEFQELVRLLVARKIPVDLTLRANELIYFFDQADSVLPLKDRLYEHPSLRKNWLETMSASHSGWTEEDYRKAHAVMPKVLEMARRFFQAGVLLYLGTDGTGGGPDYARELELHTQAGIPVWDVLAMATHLGAERLGIANRAGRIEPGREADIVFLGSNPINDIKNIRDVKEVIVNGVLHSADSLMQQAEDLVVP
jgi:imidazolonepropionase-like amidohydrolase